MYQQRHTWEGQSQQKRFFRERKDAEDAQRALGISDSQGT